MKLIVGLGNPGEKYANNRHNVGFMYVDFLLAQNTKHKSQNISNASCFMFHDFILAKPQTFMNRSGDAVWKIISNFKFQISNLVVVHDDLDIPLGKFKIQLGTGPLLHNGISSIEDKLGTKDFWRIRIGVDNRLPRRSPKGEGGTGNDWINGEAYVLQDFSQNEKETVNKVFPEIFQRLKVEKMI